MSPCSFPERIRFPKNGLHYDRTPNADYMPKSPTLFFTLRAKLLSGRRATAAHYRSEGQTFVVVASAA